MARLQFSVFIDSALEGVFNCLFSRSLSGQSGHPFYFAFVNKLTLGVGRKSETTKMRDLRDRVSSLDSQ